MPQGTIEWEKSAFDESSWESGIAQLGYGDNDENTEINTSTITAYFKKTIPGK